VLLLVRPLAAVAVLAMILGRAVGPSATGIVVGMNHVSRALELAGAIATQLFAMAATVILMASIIAVTRSKLPAALRFAAIIAGGFGVIVGLSASVIRVPGFSSAVLGAGAVLLAMGAAWDARRAPFARAFAVALGLFAVAGLMRLTTIGVAEIASARAPAAAAGLVGIARGVATASFVFDALAVLVSMTVLAAGSKKLTSPLTLIALGLAFIATRQVLLADADDAGAATLLLRRAIERLMTRPEALVPLALRVFVSALAVLAALMALFAKSPAPALTGALSLALLSRGAPDVPLGAIALIIASLSIALAARDDRGVWAAIVANKDRPRGAGG
jgi:hypothetical protein